MRRTSGWRQLGGLWLSLVLGVIGGCDEQPVADAAAVQEVAGAREGELCGANTDCGWNEHCATGVGLCGREGVCTPMPEVCDRTRDLVCGCDGKNYMNPCYAAKAAQSINNAGVCAPPPCYSNSDCAATSYCAKPTGSCEGAGTCKPRPLQCSGVFQPVCGCNNATYANSCKASSVGVSLLKNGAC